MTASEAKERINNYCSGCVGNFQGDCEKTCEFPTIIKALDLLEKAERGLIIELPDNEICYKWYRRTKSTKGKSHYIFIDSKRLAKEIIDGELEGNIVIEERRYLPYLRQYLGRTVFATKEEAEKRLDELRGE